MYIFVREWKDIVVNQYLKLTLSALVADNAKMWQFQKVPPFWDGVCNSIISNSFPNFEVDPWYHYHLEIILGLCLLGARVIVMSSMILRLAWQGLQLKKMWQRIVKILFRALIVSIDHFLFCWVCTSDILSLFSNLT